VIDAVVQRITIHQLRIPLRTKVIDAAGPRESSEPIILEVELLNGVTGYGETRPCAALAGETIETVVRDLQEIFAPLVINFHANSFPEALEFIDSLPFQDANGRIITGTRTAVELALLDASMRAFARDMDAVVQWMGLAGFGSPGSIRRIRFSGMVVNQGGHVPWWPFGWMYFFGISDFKLDVGFDGDAERVRKIPTCIHRLLARGTGTLRVDANGAWTPDEAVAWIDSIKDVPIACIEQPVPRGQEDELHALLAARFRTTSETQGRGKTPVILYDQSMITRSDATRLLGLDPHVGFNIIISKCGGLLPSLKIAALRRSGAVIQLGCMIGETSILSAAGLRFLEVCPFVRWAEACSGSSRPNGDISIDPVRVGKSGKVPRLHGPGLGIHVSPELLEKHAAISPIVINF